jgi:MFS family permease
MLGFLTQQAFIPYLAMVGMGLAYSILACALWPLVAFIVPEHQLGTAYGIMQSVQNLGLAIVPIVVGLIIDKVGYLILEVFFCVCLCCALILGIFLYLVDSTRSNGVLNMSSWARNKLAQEEEDRDKMGSTEIPRTSDGAIQVPLPHNPLRPASAFHVRNRFLSRMGAQIPEHMRVVNPLTTSMAHLGVLK